MKIAILFSLFFLLYGCGPNSVSRTQSLADENAEGQAFVMFLKQSYFEREDDLYARRACMEKPYLPELCSKAGEVLVTEPEMKRLLNATYDRRTSRAEDARASIYNQISQINEILANDPDNPIKEQLPPLRQAAQEETEKLQLLNREQQRLPEVLRRLEQPLVFDLTTANSEFDFMRYNAGLLMEAFDYYDERKSVWISELLTKLEGRRLQCYFQFVKNSNGFSVISIRARTMRRGRLFEVRLGVNTPSGLSFGPWQKAELERADDAATIFAPQAQPYALGAILRPTGYDSREGTVLILNRDRKYHARCIWTR